MKASHLLTVVLSLTLPLVGCNRGDDVAPKGNGTPSETEAAKDYHIKGNVVAIGDEKRSVTLDHEDIVGLMKGMEMKFGVEDPQVLEGIEAGDEVAGRLRVQAGNYTITKLEKR